MYRSASQNGLRPLASAAFGHGDRLGILRVQGALVIHVVLEYMHVESTRVLHNNNKIVMVSHSAVLGSAVMQCFFAALQY